MHITHTALHCALRTYTAHTHTHIHTTGNYLNKEEKKTNKNHITNTTNSKWNATECIYAECVHLLFLNAMQRLYITFHRVCLVFTLCCKAFRCWCVYIVAGVFFYPASFFFSYVFWLAAAISVLIDCKTFNLLVNWGEQYGVDWTNWASNSYTTCEL